MAAAVRRWVVLVVAVMLAGCVAQAQATGAEPLRVAVIGDSHVVLRSFEGVNRGLAGTDELSRLHVVCDQPGLGRWKGEGTEVENRGMTGRACAMADGQTRTLDVRMSALELFWLASPGSTEIRVDGELVHTAPGSTPGSWTWHGPLDEHTVEITSRGDTLVDAAFVTAGEPRVITWEIGHSGWSTQQLLELPDLMPAVSAIDPDIVVLASGTNDFRAGPEAYADWMRQMIDRVRVSAPGAGIFVWVPPETVGHSPWAPFAQAAERLAAQMAVKVIDAYRVMGSSVGPDGAPSDPRGLWNGDGDWVHFSEQGKAVNAELVLEALRPAIAGLDVHESPARG